MILAPFPTQASKLLLLASIEAILTEHWGNDAPPAPGEANTLFPLSLTLASAPPPSPLIILVAVRGWGALGGASFPQRRPRFPLAPNRLNIIRGRWGGGLMWCCL